MTDVIKHINELIEETAASVVMLEVDDIPALGNILNQFADLNKICQEITCPCLLDLVTAVEGYTEKLILRQNDDLNPLEKGISSLQLICQSLTEEAEFNKDLAPVFLKLGVENYVMPEVVEKQVEASGQIFKMDSNIDMGVESEDIPDAKETISDSGTKNIDSNEETIDLDSAPVAEELDEDEKEIIEDFVTESIENLNEIEVALIDLEQDTENIDAINSIFRPFHTIKGVSGFINLRRINKLAHSAENLLDMARSMTIKIDSTVIDIILATVDMLKKMVEGVRDGLAEGGALDIGIDINSLKNRIDNIIADPESTKKKVGEILVDSGAVKEEHLNKALEIQKEQPDIKIGEILVSEQFVESNDVTAALKIQKKNKKTHTQLQVKVETKKLDDLVNLVGELALIQSMLSQNESIVGISDQKLYQIMGQLKQISSGLQTTAMSMRMVSIKSTFMKMVRLVRDIAKNSGKEVDLQMSGEDTEIDRNVVDDLYEPLVHMIRNAVDHGIETPSKRIESGKDPKGTVSLNAYHKGGNIIVEVKDDGHGLDKVRIQEKAIAKNLITAGKDLNDSEIYSLIFEAGFSTAKEVTDISGRGVGMDVVKQGIEKLRGRVEVDSTLGKGSLFIIRLPLTLAIIEGMIVRVENERYIIPILAIKGSFRPEKKQYSTVEGKGEMILTHGVLTPLVRIGQIFEKSDKKILPWEAIVVTVEYEKKRICLLVDELLGKEDIVIKSMGETLKNVKGFAGATILGDGRVGLIIDVAGIFDLAMGK